MEELPQCMENKIFYYISHPITDMLRNKIVILRPININNLKSIHLCVNFTNYTDKGFINLLYLYLSNNEVFCKIWKLKAKNKIIN